MGFHAHLHMKSCSFESPKQQQEKLDFYNKLQLLIKEALRNELPLYS